MQVVNSQILQFFNFPSEISLMADINQLPNIITQALSGSNNVQRSQAEADLLYLRDINPTAFFLKCANLIEDQKNSQFIRQSSGTVLGRLISLKSPVNGQYYWDQINQNSKLSVKQSVLSTLISSYQSVMKAGAGVIAHIASIQLPRNQWQDLIGILCDNASHQNILIKTATITTLGFICGQLNKDRKQVSHKISEKILDIILLAAFQNDEAIVQCSLKALSDSIIFLEKVFQNVQYRNQVFAIFVTKFQKRSYMRQTYEAIFEFVKACSQFLNDYFKQFIDLSIVHLEERNQNTVLNLQLWEIIGSDVIQKSSRQSQRIGQHVQVTSFLKNASEILLPQIMKCFIILSKKQEQFDELRESASKALSTFAEACDRNIVDKITSGVSVLFNSQNPGHRQACAPIFSAISQYPDKDYVTHLFANGFDYIFKLVFDNNGLVVKNTLDGFVRLSEAFPQVFLTHRDVQVIIEKLFSFVSNQNSSIRKNALNILTNITQGLKAHPKPVSNNPQILLSKCVALFTQNTKHFFQQQKQVNQKLVSIIMNILMNTQRKDITVQLTQFMIQRYYQVIQFNAPDLPILLGYIISIIHTAILAHKNSVPSLQTLDKICALIDYQLKKFGVQEEGLSLLGSTATTFIKAFQNRSEKYWSHIKHGLEKSNQKATFKAALAAIGDWARAFQTRFNSHASQIMQSLLGFLNSSLDRQLKINVISCMGDLILSMKQYGQNFIPNIIDICDLCFTAVYQLSADPNEIQYTQQLKDTLIQMYSCMMFSMNSMKSSNEALYNHFGHLATFVVRTCDPKVHPTVEYLRNCIYLLHDSACFYQKTERYLPRVRQILGSSQVQGLTALLAQFDSRPQVRELIDYIQSRKNRR